MEDNTLSYHLTKVISELEARIAHRVVTVLSEQFQLAKETSTADEKLMTDKDMCNYLQISSTTFYKLKKKHEDFPEIRILRTVRYRKSEVKIGRASCRERERISRVVDSIMKI